MHKWDLTAGLKFNYLPICDYLQIATYSYSNYHFVVPFKNFKNIKSPLKKQSKWKTIVIKIETIKKILMLLFIFINYYCKTVKQLFTKRPWSEN